MSDDPHRELFRLAAGGDADASDRLIEATAHAVTAFVAVRAPRVDLIDEVVQETYLAALASLQDYRGEGTVLAWLKGIARHRLLRVLAARDRHTTPLDATLIELLAAAAEDQETAAIDASTRRLRQLEACLQKLSPQARELVRRHWSERVPVNRLAQQFKRTAASITGLLGRLRASLRACVDAAETGTAP